MSGYTMPAAPAADREAVVEHEKTMVSPHPSHSALMRAAALEMSNKTLRRNVERREAEIAELRRVVDAADELYAAFAPSHDSGYTTEQKEARSFYADRRNALIVETRRIRKSIAADLGSDADVQKIAERMTGLSTEVDGGLAAKLDRPGDPNVDPRVGDPVRNASGNDNGSGAITDWPKGHDPRKSVGHRHDPEAFTFIPTAPPVVTMDFGNAIRAMKNGAGVARVGWNGRGMFVCLMPEMMLPPFNMQGTARKVNDRTAKWIGEDAPLDCRPYFAMYTAQRQWQPGWLASQADMLADDWFVAKLPAEGSGDGGLTKP